MAKPSVDLRSAMDRRMIRRQLALAERHVANDEVRIVRQREIVATMKRAGWPSAAAEGALKHLWVAQQTHIADRDRFQDDLDIASARATLARWRLERVVIGLLLAAGVECKCPDFCHAPSNGTFGKIHPAGPYRSAPGLAGNESPVTPVAGFSFQPL